MPVTYDKISNEYDSVRNKCGVFDVSHMGQIKITGSDSMRFIQYLTVNDVNELKNNQAQYSAMCNEEGFIIDDLIVYKKLDNDFLIIVNASNTDNILEWMDLHKVDFDININLINKTH